MYLLFLLKRWVEDLLMYPLILTGRLIALARPLHHEFDVFFFFPFYSIGGAEKVHAQIAQAVGNNRCLIFFTRRSRNDLFLEAFKKSGCQLKDISKYTDNKWLYFLNIIYRGIISGYINHQKKKPIVFNGQCNFGYKISPWLKKKIHQVELIHSFNSFSLIRIPFLSFYTKSIMISYQTINDHLSQYKKWKIPDEYAKRIQYIQNGILLPENEDIKQEQQKLIVLYAGRATAEKRVHLVAQIAKKLKDGNAPVEVQFMGDVREAIPESLHSCVKFWGNQNDPAVIQKIYAGADVLILTSVFEGFPMVAMEAMANGLAIVSTAVGDMPYHIKEGENGFLIDEKGEKNIVDKASAILSDLFFQQPLLKEIGERNKAYALRLFGIEEFNKNYLRLFESLQHYE